MAMASWWLSEHLDKRTKHVHKQTFCSQFSLTKTYQPLSTVVVQCFSPLQTSTSYWIFLRLQFDPRRWCKTRKFGIKWYQNLLRKASCFTSPPPKQNPSSLSQWSLSQNQLARWSLSLPVAESGFLVGNSSYTWYMCCERQVATWTQKRATVVS